MRSFFSIALFLILFSTVSNINAQEGQTIPPKLKEIPEVNLSGISIDEKLSGTISVNVMVSDKGDVVKILGITGPNNICFNNAGKELAKLYDAVRLSVQDASFEAATVNGKAMEFYSTVTFEIRADVNSEEIAIGTDVPTKTIRGGVLNGKAISLPKPPYPPAATAVRARGSVSVEVVIDEAGLIEKATAISGHALLRSVSASAACRAKFSPTTLSGNPVKVSGVIVYNFVP